MRKDIIKKRDLRQKRTWRVRSNLHGSAERPRLCVVKTNKHIYAQLIDDDKGLTLGSSSTCSKQFQNTEFAKRNKVAAKKLGEHIAELAKKLNIKEVIFDRGPFRYHGILAELADAARANGLNF